MIEVSVQHKFAGFDLDVGFVAPAGVTALFGRSGAGKTTVVQAMAGLLRTDAARIVRGGQVLVDSAAGLWEPPHKRRIGYVFQDARLFPHMTVAKNIWFGARFAAGRTLGGKNAQGIIEMLDIAPLMGRMPSKLSGGETQRVAIGRALMAAPQMLLMDEPLAALDEARKQEILPYLMRLRDATQIPIVYVSHALGEVAQLANTVVVLERGRVVGAGPVDAILSDPAMVPHLGVRQAGAVLTGRVTVRHDDGLCEVAVPGGVLFVPGRPEAVGQGLRIRIAAQDVILSATRPEGLSALNILRGVILDIHEGTGPGVIVRVDLGGASILARLTQRSALAMRLQLGQEIHAIAKTVAVAAGDIGPFGNT